MTRPVDTAAAPDVDPAPATPEPAPAVVTERKQPDSRFGRKIAFWTAPLVGALLVKVFLLGVYSVPSGSMQNTLQPGDRMAVTRLGPAVPARGDVIVFDGSASFDADRPPMTLTQRFADALGRTDGRRMYVKRVLAIPGDTIRGVNGTVTISRPGQPTQTLTEPYVYEPDKVSFGPVTIPPGYVWVMGDHRLRSADSRYHRNSTTHGLVPVTYIQGTVRAVIWPLSRWTGNPARHVGP